MSYLRRAECPCSHTDGLNARAPIFPADVTICAGMAVSINSMLETDIRRRFDDLLTDDIYSLAWRYCARLCSTREDAEDLLQESLLQALRRLASLRENESFKSWLLSIVHRRFLDRCRRLQTRRRTLEGVQNEWHHQAQSAAQNHLWSVLHGLPAQSREILCLFYMEGLSTDEIATITKLSGSAVRLRLMRGRRKLRDKLTKEGFSHFRLKSQPAEAAGGKTHEC